MRSAVVYSKPFSPTIWFLCNDENNLRGHVWCVIWNQRPGLVNLHLQHRERRCDASRHVTWTPIKAVCAVCCSKQTLWAIRSLGFLRRDITKYVEHGDTVWLVHPTTEPRIWHKRTQWDTIRDETYSVWGKYIDLISHSSNMITWTCTSVMLHQ